MNPLIKVSNLNFSYGSKNIFANFNLEVNRGERVAIVGDNGFGKTTLLKILTGILKTTNNVSFNETLIENYQKREVGESICSIYTWPLEANFLTVEEYLRLVHESLYKEKLDADTIKKTLDKFNSTHLMNNYLHNMSDGQKQISKLARIDHHKGNLIILDEPTSFLDMSKKGLLADFLKTKETVIFSSHDESFIGQVATRSIKIG